MVLLPAELVKPGTTNPRPGDGDSDGLRDLVLRLFLLLHGGIATAGDAAAAAVAVGDAAAAAVDVGDAAAPAAAVCDAAVAAVAEAAATVGDAGVAFCGVSVVGGGLDFAAVADLVSWVFCLFSLSSLFSSSLRGEGDSKNPLRIIKSFA